MRVTDTDSMAGSYAARPRPEVLSIAGLKDEFLRFMPVWFIYISAVGLLHVGLASFPEEGFAALGRSRLAFVPTIAFPMAWFVGIFVLRIRRSKRLDNRWKAYAALGLLAVGVPMLITAFHRPHPLSHDALTSMFETAQIFWVVVFMVHVILRRGWHALALFFGVTFIYGLVIENTGIIMGFFYEPGFLLYLGPLPAPFCTMLGWCVVFYVTIAAVEQLAEWVPWLAAKPWRRAMATTALALSMDAQLDPLASMSGVFWRWNEALSPQILGVPVINYAAWFGAFLPFSYFFFSLQDRRDLSPRQRNWELSLRIPLAALLGGVLCFGLMALVERGFDGPTFQIQRDFSDRLMPY